MKNTRASLLPLLILTILLAGCQVFPYVVPPTAEPLTEAQPTYTPTTLPATEVLAATEPDPTATSDFTPTPEPTATSDPIIYILQEGSPLYLTNFVHASAGCDWLGVAGQVFDANGEPIPDLIVIAGQYSISESNQWAARTGLSTNYGPGGYEIQLSNHVTATTQDFWVQLVSESGTVLSDRIYFDTHEDCDRNLVLVNFVTLVADREADEGIMPQPTETPQAYP
ncbi:hypothetical protein JR338_12365 [Chloroflexota bacterium]|nr:hypothetical protein JR338_12365 [Chloroflexota bacterium]